MTNTATSAHEAAARQVVASWRRFDFSGDSLRDVPELPGLVKTTAREDTVEIVTGNLRRALQRMRSDLRDAMRGAHGEARAEWWQAPPAVLEARIAAARRGSGGLRAGRPLKISGDETVAIPAVWGLYRIRRTADDTWYVGITSNLRVRLQTHRRTGLYDPEAGDEVELIPARGINTESVVIWEDLKQAERAHIQRLRARGLVVRNITAGGNGRPPDVRFDGALSGAGGPRFGERRNRGLSPGEWWSVDADERRIPNTNELLVPLGVVLYEREQDWDLWLDTRGHVRAAGKGSGPFTKVHAGTVSATWLREEYSAELDGRNLDVDLQELQWTGLAHGQVEMHYWRPRRPTLNDEGRGRTAPSALMGLGREHVRKRQLPTSLVEQGFRIDPDFGRSNNVNEIIRVVSESGTVVYVKTERNAEAVRAEMLVSLIWHRLGWPGLAGRAIGEESNLLVKTPALGAGGIQDAGNFATHFAAHPNETRSTLRAERSFVLKRLSVGELRLRDPWDALRFLLVNAVTGNTDRHRENVHYGIEEVRRQPVGYLLPVDHGRCVFNNQGVPGRTIVGSPAEIVTGSLGNPHQMLRPVVELLEGDLDTASSVATSYLAQLLSVLVRIRRDPGWQDFSPELQALEARCRALEGDLEVFFEACDQVVVR